MASAKQTTNTASLLFHGCFEVVPDVAERFCEVFVAAFQKTKATQHFCVFLSGGPTAQACYQRLARYQKTEITWQRVDLFMGDERFVPITSPDSNAGMVLATLVDHVGPVGSFLPMVTSGDLNQSARAYGEILQNYLATRSIDFIHLGMGTDGHTASLFPGDLLSLENKKDLVIATNDRAGNNYHPRLSVTMGLLNTAKRAVFTVAGASKADIVARLVSGEDLPASHVHAKEVTWILDFDAAKSTQLQVVGKS